MIIQNGPVYRGSAILYTSFFFVCANFVFSLIRNLQGQLLESVECHIYLYFFTFDDINLNRALVIIVLFPTKYSNKKVCANDIGK